MADRRRGSFETTHWSLVLRVGGDGSSAARSALSTLCEAYWYPLYAYVRRQGHDEDDARDLTQAFLLALFERGDLRRVDPGNGKFRSFLLAALRHFMLNDLVWRRRQKRGGGVTREPLDFDNAERRYRREPADSETPEVVFDRQWALAVLEQVLCRLRREWRMAGKAPEFNLLKSCLMGEPPPGGYRGVAERLGSTEGAVKTAVYRMRQAFQRELRSEIAQTVAEADVDAEIRYLIAALQR